MQHRERRRRRAPVHKVAARDGEIAVRSAEARQGLLNLAVLEARRRLELRVRRLGNRQLRLSQHCHDARLPTPGKRGNVRLDREVDHVCFRRRIALRL
eukprot:6538414-Prymnesium_polylepis.1